MKSKILLLVAWLLVFVGIVSSCTTGSDQSANESGADSSISETSREPLPTVNAAPSSADSMKGHTVIEWWDGFSRFIYENKNASEVKSLNGDAGGCFVQDEGRGPYMRENTMTSSGQGTINSFHALGLKASAWLEGQGDSRISIAAIRQNSDGTYELNPQTGAAKTLATHWTWRTGDLAANSGANQVVWMGVHSFVSEEAWQGELILSNYPDIIKPTYPDGSDATGYLTDASDPTSSMLYDSSAAKDINGNYIRFDQLGTAATTEYGLKLVDSKGQTYYTTDFAIAKDTSSPFWASYNIAAAKYFMSKGIDFFWIDNWSGWDNISSKPIKSAFGDWSEYNFKQYLKDHPEVGVQDPDSFSITEYVRAKALELDENADVANADASVWSFAAWLDDPIWRAYLCYKSETNKTYNTSLYQGIKNAAAELGLDPDTIGIGTNDFPYLTFGAFDCDTIDIVHTEYMNEYNIGSGSVTSGNPPHGYSGHTYNLLSNTGKSKNAVAWYYHNGNDALATLYGYEALAYNCTLYGGGCTNISMLKVNTTIGKVQDTFSGRQIYAEIGVVFSPESEVTFLTPGGEKDDNTTVDYISWCHAFDELNIPYRAVQFQKLKDEISMFSVLVLPNITSLDPLYIDQVLVPFLDNGGTLIIIGENSGKYSSMANALKQNDSCVLAELAETYSGEGKVIYYSVNPLRKYIKLQKNANESDIQTLYNDYLSDIEDLYTDLIKEGRLNRLVRLRSFPDSGVVTLNYNVDTNTFFCDLVNMQYNQQDGTITKTNDNIQAVLRLPSSLWSKYLDVQLMNADGNRLTSTSDYSIDGEYITVNIPSFEYYISIIISAE